MVFFGVPKSTVKRCLRALEHSDKGADMEFICMMTIVVTGENANRMVTISITQKPPEIILNTQLGKMDFNFCARNFTFQFIDLRINVHLIGSKKASVP